MRHIDVATLYVPEFVHQKLLNLGEVAGTANLANCLTKVLKGQCIQDLGMVDLNPRDLHPNLEKTEHNELIVALLGGSPAKKAPPPSKPNLELQRCPTDMHMSRCSNQSHQNIHPGRTLE